MLVGFFSTSATASIVETIERTRPKVVKIYGAGGLRGMVNYQTGILISSEGHILTAFSHVLDTDELVAVLDDGRRFDAALLGADPRLEAAVLKIDAAGLPCFDLSKAVRLDPGAGVLALSNAFGVAVGSEPVGAQHGAVSALAPLQARHGAFDSPYHGPVYVLDASTNNSGAAGGALVDQQGRLAGMLGKELRNRLNHTWLNYAIPIDELRPSVEAIRAGKTVSDGETDARRRPSLSLDLDVLGIVLIPDVLERTPPYVDDVRPGSAAAAAGVRPDDLIVLLGDRLIQTCKSLRDELVYVDHEDPVALTVLRDGETIEFTLQSAAGTPGKESP